MGTAKELTPVKLGRLCCIKEKCPPIEHKNKFDALKKHDEDDDEREHSTSTAGEIDIQEFPMIRKGQKKSKRTKKMSRLSKSSQRARRRELIEINKDVKYIMSQKIPLRKQEETASLSDDPEPKTEDTCLPPPPVSSFKRDRASRRKKRLMTF